MLGYGIGTVQILSGKINKAQTGHSIQRVLYRRKLKWIRHILSTWRPAHESRVNLFNILEHVPFMRARHGTYMVLPVLFRCRTDFGGPSRHLVRSQPCQDLPRYRTAESEPQQEQSRGPQPE